jgi:hypothetical protein
MRKSPLLIALAGLLVAVPALAQQLSLPVPAQDHAGENVWRVRGDDGELVHVLPGPASAEAWEHRFGTQEPAVRVTNYSVFNASYGTVPGQLNDHGGAVVSNAAFQPVFYNAATASSLQSGIDNFLTNYSGSDPGMKVITQYSKTGNTISSTLTHVADFVDNKTAPNRISDSGVRSYLTGLFNAGKLSANNHTIYGVYLPNGTVSTNGSSRSCTSYCGYHSSYTYNGITVLYAVFPYNNCSGCSLSGKTVVDMETIVSSHEIREAITDPVNAWWESSSGYEADDKCAWHNLYQQAGGAWVQPEYSNALAGWPRGCVTP